MPEVPDEFLDEESLLDILGEEEEEIDPCIEDSVKDAIENTLEEIDGSISFGVRLSMKPQQDWTDIYEPKFKSGDLIVAKGRDRVYKVISYGLEINTFEVKGSNDNTTTVIDGMQFEHAPAWAEWEPYKDTSDPLQVPGLKISCPSNNIKFGKKKS